MTAHPQPGQLLVDAARHVESRKLNSGTAGNISVRVDGGMLITPTGITVDRLSPDQMVKMDLEGNWSGEVRPSSEWAMHAAIYSAFAAAQAVVHAHPDHCVALSCLRERLPPFHYMIASFGGDDVRCSRYECFGSAELAAAAVDALRDRNACLLANHGMIAFAADLPTAIARTEKLEMLARQYMLARTAGVPVLLGPDDLAVVKERYGTYGQQKP
jgi:L-fuculose-phosphate aldolase